MNMVSQCDNAHFPIFKKRRCFIYNNQYFQLDIYREPCHPRYESKEHPIRKPQYLSPSPIVFLIHNLTSLCVYLRCKGLILLETYSALNDDDMASKLPPFLKIDCEVTGNPDYSMFNLSLVEDWNNSDKFCNDFKGT